MFISDAKNYSMRNSKLFHLFLFVILTALIFYSSKKTDNTKHIPAMPLLLL